MMRLLGLIGLSLCLVYLFFVMGEYVVGHRGILLGLLFCYFCWRV